MRRIVLVALTAFGIVGRASSADAESPQPLKPSELCGYHSESHHGLGDLHIQCRQADGSWVTKDDDAESKWLLEQAKHGAWQAMALVADRYEHGVGLPKDEAAATHWRKLRFACVSLIAFLGQRCDDLWNPKQSTANEIQGTKDAANAAAAALGIVDAEHAPARAEP